MMRVGVGAGLGFDFRRVGVGLYFHISGVERTCSERRENCHEIALCFHGFRVATGKMCNSGQLPESPVRQGLGKDATIPLSGVTRQSVSRVSWTCKKAGHILRKRAR